MKHPVHSAQPAPPQPQKQVPEKPQTRPELVHTFTRLWQFIILIEVLHQITNLVMTVISRQQMVHILRESLGDQEMSDSLLGVLAIVSAVIMLLLACAILGYAYYASRRVYAGGKVGIHLRMLSFFAIYFFIRSFFVFFANPTGTQVPIAFYAVDGCLQIATGVSAVLALWAGGKKEVFEWVGVPLPAKKDK